MGVGLGLPGYQPGVRITEDVNGVYNMLTRTGMIMTYIVKCESRNDDNA